MKKNINIKPVGNGFYVSFIDLEDETENYQEVFKEPDGDNYEDIISLFNQILYFAGISQFEQSKYKLDYYVRPGDKTKPDPKWLSARKTEIEEELSWIYDCLGEEKEDRKTNVYDWDVGRQVRITDCQFGHGFSNGEKVLIMGYGEKNKPDTWQCVNDKHDVWWISEEEGELVEE